jgi:propane monooxygenase coupling protein
MTGTDADKSATDDSGTYDNVGIIMSKSIEGDAVAAVMSRHEGVRIIENASFWDIQAKDRMTISYDEVSEELGFEVDGYSMQTEMSTHYGRMVNTDDALLLFSDPIEAMEYLSS